MKLTDVDVIVTGNPPPGFGGRYFIFVKVRTDTGLIGWGECYAATVGPETMRSVITDVFERHMAGENPENIELMFRRVYSSGFTQRPDPTVIGAFSGLEIACWDILGKDRDRPIHALIGGCVQDRLRAYTYLYPDETEDAAAFYGSADRAAEVAVDRVAEGFTAVKFDPAGPYTIMGGHQPTPEDLERARLFCTRIRAAVGARADLLFGTHGQFTAAGAIRMARAIAPADPLWFEEPVPPDDPVAMAQVAAASPVPIATGERLCTITEFLPLLERRAAGVLQPALGRLGGIWEGRKLAILAQTMGAQIAPHLYAGPIEWAANLQLGAALPNFLIAESIGTGTGMHEQLLTHPIQFERGYLLVPTGAGLGVELNETVARAHPYNGDRLHLEMHPDPHTPATPPFAGG
ncbi:MAG: mandelate racemase/muconate lactonizing enzyme family protein [Pseudomonadota bacterium]